MRSNLRKAFELLTCSVVFAAVAGASSCDGPPRSEVTEITLLHTNDVHSNFRADPEHSEKNPYGLGGIARLKTLVDRVRSAKPNTLLLDAGDWAEANMYFTIDAGSNTLRIMDAIGYDAVVVGNHDFLNGPSEMASTIVRAHPSFPLLGANKNLELVADRERIARWISDRTVITVGGVRVGIIGLMTDDLEYTPYFRPAIITNVFEAAAKHAKELHDKNLADVIVLLSHNAIEKQIAWAKTVPWVNVIVSGHSHFKTARPITVTNGGNPAYVVEAKQWGQFLGDLTLRVEKQNGRAVSVTMKNYTLHPVSGDIPENAAIASMVDEQDRLLSQKYFKEVITDHVADSTDEMVHDEIREVPLVNLSADAYRWATAAQIGLESVKLTGKGLQPGPLSTMDLFNVAPHIFSPIPNAPFPEYGKTYTLKSLRLRGFEARALLNLVMFADAIGVPLGWIGVSGMQIDYDTKDLSANPIKRMRVLNAMTGEYQALNDEATYSVSLHDGLLLAVRSLLEKIPLELDLSHITETGIQTWQAVVGFAEQKKILRANDYEAGTRYRTLGADLGFYEHQIRFRPSADRKSMVADVTVKNEGLASSSAGYRLRALRSSPNDPVNDFTAGNERFAIGDAVEIPALAPGEQRVISLPWTDLAGPGVYALRVELIGEDSNPKNNVMTVHTRVPLL